MSTEPEVGIGQVDPGVILVHLALSQARQMGSVPLPIYSANDPDLFADRPQKISPGGVGSSKCRVGRSFWMRLRMGIPIPGVVLVEGSTTNTWVA